MRKGSLWSNVVFEKEGIFHVFDFETSELGFEVSKSSSWKHTTSCDKGIFSSIIISQLQRPIEFKFSQVCYLVHWDTPSDKTGLWHLPKVSSVFKLSIVSVFILFFKYLLEYIFPKSRTFILRIKDVHGLAFYRYFMLFNNNSADFFWTKK